MHLDLARRSAHSELTTLLSEFPQVEALSSQLGLSQPIRDNVNQSVYGQMGQIALKIFYHDLKELQATAEAMRDAIATVKGVADLGIVKSAPIPQLQIHPQRELMGRFGLSMAEVQHFISVAVGGSPVGTLWEGELNFDVVLRLPDAARGAYDRSTGGARSDSGCTVPRHWIRDTASDCDRDRRWNAVSSPADADRSSCDVPAAPYAPVCTKGVFRSGR